jgi:hypothetical protein
VRILYADGPVCDLQTLKRLLVIADKIAFANKPSVVFKDWGLVGVQCPVRPYSKPDSPISISVHAPPSGPLSFYGGSMLQNFTNPEFVRTFLEGLALDDGFAARQLGLDANYGDAVRATAAPVVGLSVAYILHVPLASALAAAAASIPVAISDVLGKGREAKSKNPISYLIGLRNMPARGDPLSIGMP